MRKTSQTTIFIWRKMRSNWLIHGSPLEPPLTKVFFMMWKRMSTGKWQKQEIFCTELMCGWLQNPTSIQELCTMLLISSETWAVSQRSSWFSLVSFWLPFLSIVSTLRQPRNFFLREQPTIQYSSSMLTNQKRNIWRSNIFLKKALLRKYKSWKSIGI